MHEMTKQTFKVERDAKSRKYVVKNEHELQKNHREDDNTSTSGIMPEKPGDPTCPVTSYEKYLAKLNPELNRLWQFPLDSFLEDGTWFAKRPIGRNTMAQFMSKLSKSAQLSRIYTNHSLRATAATILGETFTPLQVMSVTGHKAVSSLASYQQTSREKKIEMGQKITDKLTSQSQLAIYKKGTTATQPQVRETATAVRPTQAYTEIEVMQFSQNRVTTLVPDTNTEGNIPLPQLPTSLFSGCNLSGATININFK
jgi:hypothetical protein